MNKVHFVHPDYGIVGIKMDKTYTEEDIGKIIEGQPQAKKFNSERFHGKCRVVSVGEKQRYSTSPVTRQDVWVEFGPSFWDKLENKIGRPPKPTVSPGRKIPPKPRFPAIDILRGIFG